MWVFKTCSRTAQRTQENPKRTYFHLQGSFFIMDNILEMGGLSSVPKLLPCKSALPSEGVSPREAYAWNFSTMDRCLKTRGASVLLGGG